jgi:hypothetical protein
MSEPLDEFKNLTQSELNQADHYAEIGDFAAVRSFAKLSKKREQQKNNVIIKDGHHE